jgi:hypothetical protein
VEVKVIKRFRDKTADLVTRKIDDELDVTPERAKELIAKGFVEKIDKPEPKTTKK